MNVYISAVPYTELNRHTKTIPTYALQEYMVVKLMADAHGCRFFDIRDVHDPDGELIPIHHIKYDKHHHWMDIPTRLLNTKAGMHVYKLSFMDHSEHVRLMYFAYIIQDSNPEKPYIYMNREDS